MAGKDKNKTAGKENPVASEREENTEIEGDDTLSNTVRRIQDLVNNTLKEIGVLGQTVKSNKKAVEVNAASIKDVEKDVKGIKTDLAQTNEKVDTVSARLAERLQTTEKLLELNRKVAECSEAVSQRELNESSLFLALNGISMAKPAKDLDLRNINNDRKIVTEALENALGAEAAKFVLKVGSDGELLNIHGLRTPSFQRRNYPDRVPNDCKNTLIFSFKNRGQLAHFERAIRRRLASTREERKGGNAEFLDLNIYCPGRAGQLLESVLNSQARVTVGSCENLAGWRLVWKKRFRSSNDMMIYAEVKASTTWMESAEMKDYFFDNDGQQTRAQWPFLKNINASNPKQSFFPRLKPRNAEAAQDKTRKTISSEVVTTEDADEEENGAKDKSDSQPEKNKKTEKELGAKGKTGTRSKSPRIQIADNKDDEGAEDEEQNAWLSAGSRNGRRGAGRGGRGGNRGERNGKAGRETSSSQASMRDFISTPKTRLASGASGVSSWSK